MWNIIKESAWFGDFLDLRRTREKKRAKKVTKMFHS